jgi:hypothetical protein
VTYERRTLCKKDLALGPSIIDDLAIDPSLPGDFNLCWETVLKREYGSKTVPEHEFGLPQWMAWRSTGWGKKKIRHSSPSYKKLSTLGHSEVKKVVSELYDSGALIPLNLTAQKDLDNLTGPYAIQYHLLATYFHFKGNHSKYPGGLALQQASLVIGGLLPYHGQYRTYSFEQRYQKLWRRYNINVVKQLPWREIMTVYYHLGSKFYFDTLKIRG